MNITCEHCGCSIDIDKDKKCPNCGAPYADNREYKEVKEYNKKNKDYDLREREANIETKELANKLFERTMNGSKKVSVFISIIAIFIVTMVIIIAATTFMSFKDETSNADFINDIREMTNSEKEEVVVSFNENAKTDLFEIKCDKVSEYKYDFFEKKDFKDSEFKVYNFEIVFKNNKKRLTTLNNITLTYTDKDGNEDVIAKNHNVNVDESKKSLDIFADDTLTHKGNMAYEIPNYVKDVKIIFNNVTIKIDNFKEKI